MNCKPGDLAMFVGFTQRTVFVEVLERYTGREFAGMRTTLGEWAGPCWLVRVLSHKGFNHNGDVVGRLSIAPVPDANLRPIRPGDITDEEVRDLYAPRVPEAA